MPETAPAETVVFIPGLTSTGTLFGPQINSLKERPIIIAETCAMDSIGAMAQRLLDHAPEKFALLGMSMGGYVALEVIRLAPERISRLALINTNARGDTPAQTQLRHTQIEIARKGGFHKIASMQYPQLVHPARHDDTALRQVVFDMAADIGADNFLKQQNAIINRRDQRPDLPAIQCPAIIVAGEEDSLLPLDRCREMHDAIPNSKLHIIPDCGHLSTLEHPVHTSELIQDWLDA
ncbi:MULTISPECIES: alpha/beta fold hydrolase [unclassified Pseudovibrio]|uniref:alpha/beta fold hydrolase n=1 Tax=unclassified Pseudovibrio TaxID=2627060 RepID=UPI0007B3150F|nr:MULTISPECIES: alpha/beta hydrolase [unclassified Pseudovibrio]KZL20395.1 putative aminoacrylate hydrolase RutD [Pseudovibrio sp. WM33]KZL29612.1 putative aminoacrylate hydrolase RutD [Pseudovibrio sp. Ad37]